MKVIFHKIPQMRNLTLFLIKIWIPLRTAVREC